MTTKHETITVSGLVGAVKVEDVRESLDTALREADLRADNHPWHSKEDCRAHNEGLSCCLDPDHKDYDSLLDYLADRIVRGLPKRCDGRRDYYVDDGDGHHDHMHCDDCGEDHDDRSGA